MIRNPDDFRSQLKLFAKLADNADDAELFEILNALKTHETYGRSKTTPISLAPPSALLCGRSRPANPSARTCVRTDSHRPSPGPFCAVLGYPFRASPGPLLRPERMSTSSALTLGSPSMPLIVRWCLRETLSRGGLQGGRELGVRANTRT
jgi:hypothetical protein